MSNWSSGSLQSTVTDCWFSLPSDTNILFVRANINKLQNVFLLLKKKKYWNSERRVIF